MPELLARHTGMPVRLVSDETRVEPDHVYVIPPDGAVGYALRFRNRVSEAAPPERGGFSV